jgi:DNA-binding Lrp family transcriptional regulator
MTVKAFITCRLDGGDSTEIIDTIKGFAETEETWLMFGAWDLLIKAKFEDNESLSSYVVDRIKTITGIGEVQTNVCADFC